MQPGIVNFSIGAESFTFMNGEVPDKSRLNKAAEMLLQREAQLEAQLAAMAGGDRLAQSAMGFPVGTNVAQDMNSVPYNTWGPLAKVSVSSILTDLTMHPDEDFSMWSLLPHEKAYSTIHNYRSRQSYGSRVTAFMGEGKVPGVSQSNYRMDNVRMRFLGEFRELTNVAEEAPLEIVGNAMNAESADGLKDLYFKIQGYLFWADSACNPLEFDGLYASIKRGTLGAHIHNQNNNVITAQEINFWLTWMSLPPRGGRITDVLTEPLVYTSIVNQIITQHGRVELQPTPSGNMVFWIGGVLHCAGPYGNIPIRPIQFIRTELAPMEGSEGDGAPAPLSGLSPSITPVSAGTFAGEFDATDATLNWYFVVEAWGDQGTTASAMFAATSPLAGGSLQFDFADNAIAKYDANSIRKYVVYGLGLPTSAPAPTRDQLRPMGQFGRNTANSGNTRFYVTREFIPNTGLMFFLTNKIDAVSYVDFLPVMRRPVYAHRAATTQWMLQHFGTLVVKAPYRHMVIRNIRF